jgi:hypothetical protein
MKKYLPLLYIALLGLFLLYGGCASNPKQPSEVNSTEGVDAQLEAIIAAQGLTGDPSTGRDIPDIEDPLAQLGMKLFFTKALGGQLDSACVTCHHPALGGGDALPISIGIEAVNEDVLGPGRRHVSGFFTVPRNAPTTFNIVMWDEVLFWDGRIESLRKVDGAHGAGGGIATPDSWMYPGADPNAGDDLTDQTATPGGFGITLRRGLGTTVSAEASLKTMSGFLSFRQYSGRAKALRRSLCLTTLRRRSVRIRGPRCLWTPPGRPMYRVTTPR